MIYPIILFVMNLFNMFYYHPERNVLFLYKQGQRRKIDMHRKITLYTDLTFKARIAL